MSAENQAETRFYKRHYSQSGPGLRIANTYSSAENDWLLAPGTRYWLAGKGIGERAKPADKLIELGCGDARVLFEIARRASLTDVTGIDGAFGEPRTLEGMKLLTHNLNEQWPFEDRSADHILAMMIFEHLLDPFHCFEEIKRILTPTGRAYVNLPIVTAIRNRMRMAAGMVPVTSVRYRRWFEDREWDGGHLHYFSIGLIKKLAAACGLSVEEMRGVGTFHQLKSLFPSVLASELTFSLKHC